MRKKRLITCIMVIAVVCMINVNAFAANRIFMGSKSPGGTVNFSITSYLYAGVNTAEKLGISYMETKIVNNGAGPVDYFRYRVTNNNHNVLVEQNTDADGIPSVLPGENDVFETPQPLATLQKIVICEIGASSGSDMLWLLTISDFPAGTTANYNH